MDPIIEDEAYQEPVDTVRASYMSLLSADQASNYQSIEKNLDLDLCLQSYNDEKYDKFVLDSISEAKSLGVNSTPTFFVNGYMIKGADLLKIVEAINKFSE